MRCSELAKRVSVLRGRKEQLLSTYSVAQQRLKELDAHRQNCEKAQALIQFVAKQTQDQLEYKISELTSCALDAIFPRPYRLTVRFDTKRGRTECALLFTNPNGDEVTPMDATGFGPVDVASFALRLTMQTIQIPRKRPLVILDEPFKFVSKDLLPQVSELLHELSTQTGIMFVIITHESRLIWETDAVFRVAQKNGESYIVQDGVETVPDKAQAKRPVAKATSKRSKTKKKSNMEEWTW